MRNPMSNEFFPLTAKYDKDWVRQNSFGGDTLYCLESLCEVIRFKKGMRILDLGCGNAISSIFLAKEFNVQVWAVDVEVSPAENYRRVIEADCNNNVFPIKANARDLPFPSGFFDAVVANDAYPYFGMDERYLAYIVQFLKPEGLIGIIDACFTRELNSLLEVPEYLKQLYLDDWYSVHSIDWWKNFWEKTGLVKVLCADVLPRSDFIWQEVIKNTKDIESERNIINALLNDTEKLIAFFRLVAQRTKKKIYLESFEQAK